MVRQPLSAPRRRQTIDPSTPLTLIQAAKQIPRPRGKKPVHPTTIYRWIRYGLHGVRLRALSCGDTLMVTSASLDEFFRKVADAKNPPTDAEKKERATRNDDAYLRHSARA